MRGAAGVFNPFTGFVTPGIGPSGTNGATGVGLFGALAGIFFSGDAGVPARGARAGPFIIFGSCWLLAGFCFFILLL